MKLSNYVSNCRHPRVITNSRGREVPVSCGHCPDCYARKATRQTMLCTELANQYKYCYFVTLKYSESYVPTLVLRQRDNIPALIVNSKSSVDPDDYLEITSCLTRIYGVDITKRPTKTRGLKPLKTYGDILCSINTSFEDPLFRKFYQQTNIQPKYASPARLKLIKTTPILRYLRKEDLQNFNKRLRSHLSKLGDFPYKFFGVGEYGPTTFRPHFHVLLFFNEPRLTEHIIEAVNKSWKYGSVTCEPSANKTDGSYYLASYLNSFLTLPDFLKHPNIRPFSSHSIGIASKDFQDLKEIVYDDVTKATIEFDAPLSSGVYTFYPSRSNISKLFPRCYNYDNQTRRVRLYLYTFYNKAISDYGITHNTSELANYVYNNLDKYRDLVRYLELEPCIEAQEECVPDLLLPGSYRSRIYTTLRTSYLFLRYLVDKNYTPSDVLDRIESFYRYRSLYQLSVMYGSMEQYHKETSSTDYSIFWLNLPKYAETIYNKSTYIRNINKVKDLEYLKKIKHKTINDLNRIYVDVI